MQVGRLRGLGFLLAALAFARHAAAANVNEFSNFSLTSGSMTVLPGRLYIPPEAAINPSEPRPLVVFLHGAGEAGSNNSAQVNANIDNLLAEAKRRGAFLYAPQSAGSWAGAVTTDRVMTMVDRALAEQNVDSTRLYVTGLSNGGGGAWNILSRYADRFAAGVPICGVTPASGFAPARLLDQAVWAFHARNDATVSVATSRNVISSLLAAGQKSPPTYPTTTAPDFLFTSPDFDLRYTEYRLGGHGIWGQVYNTPTMYDWLFAHATAVPEPTTAALATAGLALGVLLRARRWRQLSQ